MATVKGTSPPAFGIEEDALSLITQKITVTEKTDKKELRDKQGDTKNAAYYNENVEFSFEGYGNVTLALAEEITLPDGVTVGVAGLIFADEITRDYTNEDFVKSTIKGMAYKLITT